MGRIRFLSLFVILGLLFAACGDDDDTATDDTTTTTADDSDDDEGGLSDAERDEIAAGMGRCGFLVGFAEIFADTDFENVFASGEAMDFGQLYDSMAAGMRQVADAAPSEIQDAFQTVAAGFTAVADELDGVVLDMSDPAGMDPEVMAKLEGMDQQFDAEFEQASSEIEQWLEANCADMADAFDMDMFGR
jgi:hypothetical protein